MKKIFCILLTLSMASAATMYANNCDTSQMSIELEEAYEADQEVRRELMPVIAEYQESGKGALRLLRIKWKMDRVDSANQKMLNEWMDSCGWPDELSSLAHNAVFMILQHGELEDMKEHIGELERKVNSGHLAPDDHATMSDRIAMYEGRAQRFGTQTFQTNESENTVWPVISIDSLNTWRAGVGLPTMEQYVAIARDSMGVTMVMDSTLTLEAAIRLRED